MQVKWVQLKHTECRGRIIEEIERHDSYICIKFQDKTFCLLVAERESYSLGEPTRVEDVVLEENPEHYNYMRHRWAYMRFNFITSAEHLEAQKKNQEARKEREAENERQAYQRLKAKFESDGQPQEG